MGKNLSARQETQVQSLGLEEPLEKEMANPLQYSHLDNPMVRRAWWAIVQGLQRVRRDRETNTFTFNNA